MLRPPGLVVRGTVGRIPCGPGADCSFLTFARAPVAGEASAELAEALLRGMTLTAELERALLVEPEIPSEGWRVTRCGAGRRGAAPRLPHASRRRAYPRFAAAKSQLTRFSRNAVT